MELFKVNWYSSYSSAISHRLNFHSTSASQTWMTKIFSSDWLAVSSYYSPRQISCLWSENGKIVFSSSFYFWICWLNIDFTGHQGSSDQLSCLLSSCFRTHFQRPCWSYHSNPRMCPRVLYCRPLVSNDWFATIAFCKACKHPEWACSIALHSSSRICEHRYACSTDSWWHRSEGAACIGIAETAFSRPGSSHICSWMFAAFDLTPLETSRRRLLVDKS